MALIRCPHCGHQVLSVASRCPSCANRLTPDLHSVGSLNELEPCPRCEGLLVRGSKECPHCGYAASRWRTARVLGSFGLVAVAVALFFIVVPQLDRNATPAPVRSAGEVQAAPAAAPVTAAPLEVTRSDTARNALSSSVESSAPVATDPGVAISRVEPRVANVRVLFTNEWANVRSGRGLLYRVARVLPPGARVTVSDRVAGWWTLLDNDSVLGYVAASLLDTIPPRER